VPTLLAPAGVLPVGTRLEARVTQSIGTVPAMGPDREADLTRRGQRFHALLVTPIVDSHERVRVPPGALVQGRIAALSRGQGVRPPHLELSIERLCHRPLRARVVDPPVTAIPHSIDRTTLAGATFSWLFMGAICFGVPGFMLGATVGSSGGAIAQTEEVVNEGWLSAGTVITIEVDAPAPLGPPCAAG
jgi:hypothetical protein